MQELRIVYQWLGHEKDEKNPRKYFFSSGTISRTCNYKWFIANKINYPEHTFIGDL